MRACPPACPLAPPAAPTHRCPRCVSPAGTGAMATLCSLPEHKLSTLALLHCCCWALLGGRRPVVRALRAAPSPRPCRPAPPRCSSPPKLPGPGCPRAPPPARLRQLSAARPPLPRQRAAALLSRPRLAARLQHRPSCACVPLPPSPALPSQARPQACMCSSPRRAPRVDAAPTPAKAPSVCRSNHRGPPRPL